MALPVEMRSLEALETRSRKEASVPTTILLNSQSRGLEFHDIPSAQPHATNILLSSWPKNLNSGRSSDRFGGACQGDSARRNCIARIKLSSVELSKDGLDIPRAKSSMAVGCSYSLRPTRWK